MRGQWEHGKPLWEEVNWSDCMSVLYRGYEGGLKCWDGNRLNYSLEPGAVHYTPSVAVPLSSEIGDCQRKQSWTWEMNTPSSKFSRPPVCLPDSGGYGMAQRKVASPAHRPMNGFTAGLPT